MAQSSRYELGVGLLLVVALAVLALMALQLGALDRLGDRVELTAAFEDVNGLTKGAVVAIAGVRIGEVSELVIDHDRAVVRLSIDPAAGVRRDARARVRARSMLGEKFISIEPQGQDAPLAQDGDSLVSAGPQVEMDQVMSSMAPVMGALDPDAAAAALSALSQALQDDPERLARMVANLDTLLENSARASERLPAVLDQTEQTLVAARRSLAAVDRRVQAIDPLIGRADVILAEGERLSPQGQALLTEAQGLLTDTRGVVQKVDGATDNLDEILHNLEGLNIDELERLIREEGVLVRLRPRHGE